MVILAWTNEGKFFMQQAVNVISHIRVKQSITSGRVGVHSHRYKLSNTGCLENTMTLHRSNKEESQALSHPPLCQTQRTNGLAYRALVSKMWVIAQSKIERWDTKGDPVHWKRNWLPNHQAKCYQGPDPWQSHRLLCAFDQWFLWEGKQQCHSPTPRRQTGSPQRVPLCLH